MTPSDRLQWSNLRLSEGICDVQTNLTLALPPYPCYDKPFLDFAVGIFPLSVQSTLDLFQYILPASEEAVDWSSDCPMYISRRVTLNRERPA